MAEVDFARLKDAVGRQSVARLLEEQPSEDPRENLIDSLFIGMGTTRLAQRNPGRGSSPAETKTWSDRTAWLHSPFENIHAIIKPIERSQRSYNPGSKRYREYRELGAEREKMLPRGFAPMNGRWSRWREFERRETRETLGKQGPETRTGRRFEASACWYNTRVKLSLKPLIQLREPDLNRRPGGYLGLVG